MTRLFLALLLALGCGAVAAQDLRPALLLTAAQSRDSQDLSGQWTYSKDLYRTGLTDINGWVAKSRMQRYRDINVADEESRGGAGAEELISLIVQAYAVPGDEVLFSQYGFIKYELAARAFGAVSE